MTPRGSGFAAIAKELRRFPVAVYEEYVRSGRSMGRYLAEEQALAWAQEGVAIAQKTVRSWEAASEYFRVSPHVLKYLTVAEFMQWAQSGGSLCQDSPTVSVALFKASPDSLMHLQPKHIPAWVGLGRSLYKGTWKSSALSSRFFAASPDLLRFLSFRELERFVSLVEALSYKSYDLATECLALGQQVFPEVGSDREAFISLALALAENSWREVKGCLEAASRVTQNVEEDQRIRFLLLAERMARKGMTNVSGFLVDGSVALGKLDRRQHRPVLDLCEVLVRHSLEAVPAFLGSTLKVLERISETQLESWFDQGLKILRDNPEGGVAYFKLESTRAEQVVDNLSSSVELERIREVMRMYCRALAGATVDIQPTKELVGKGIGWVSAERPATEGTRVYLPPVVDRYPHKEGNFAWFKVVSTHQVAHLEFGSFQFAFDRPAALFTDLRPLAASGAIDLTATETAPAAPPEDGRPAAEGAVSAERGWLTDMSRFFDLFPNRKLALDIFTAVEDSRLDYRVKQEYQGIVPAYLRIQRDALAERPPMEEMPLQQALVELLVRLSLHQFKGLSAPHPYLKEARLIAALMRQVLHPEARVEDSAEAALRIYGVISRLPNNEVPPEEWRSEDFADVQFSEEDLQELLAQLQGRPVPMKDLSPEAVEQAQPYESPPQVEYRGDFKPELAQLLAKLKQKDGAQGDAQGQPLTKEELEELLKRSAELELDAEAGQISSSAGLYANNLMKEAGLQVEADQPGRGYGPFPHEGDDGGPLESKEPLTFVYDEWDFRADDYKPRWCIVRQKAIAEGETQFFTDTLRSNTGLMAQIRRQFEMVVPETFRKIKYLNDGDDVELDAAIEAMLDKRLGIPPSEKVYWRRNKVERDVAVVFLLDMSASTAEAIDESKRLISDWDAPDDPVEYMIWLRSRRGQGMRRNYKRIIDIEKESMVLLTTALEMIGDVYGIYGFSGYGRENVEFYVIKDIGESFSDRVKRRMDKISPLHATRMGPAIRHAASKLEGQDARTKILFLISDGRPQDRSYSREGVEKEYAVHDTKMALTEARRKNIVPFCLTVDKAGHDYLKTMCSDMGYEVLSDVSALPRRLPLLYRRLTT